MEKNTNELFRFMNLRAPENKNFYVSDLQDIADVDQNGIIDNLNEIKDIEEEGKTATNTRKLKTLSRFITSISARSLLILQTQLSSFL